MVDLHKRVLHKSDCQCKQNSQRRRKILQNIFEVEIRNKHRSTKFRLSLFQENVIEAVCITFLIALPLKYRRLNTPQ